MKKANTYLLSINQIPLTKQELKELILKEEII
jgi:hypothetical protein